MPGTPGRVTRTNFRVICHCQAHSGNALTRAFRNLTHRAKVYGGALIVAAPLAVGATSIPVDEILSLARAASAVSPAPARKNSEKSAPAQPYELVTDVVRDSFLSGEDGTLTINREEARKRFFNTEVPFGRLIYQEARKNDLPPELVAAVIDTESEFRPALISSKNAQGLMQIIPETGRFMGAQNLMDPADNVRVGTRYLRYLHRRFRGNRQLILAAYNAGEGNIARFNGIPPFRETANYLVRVDAREREYSRRVSEAITLSRDCAE